MTIGNIMYDYLLLNGHVIDPENNIDDKLDIAIKNNKIAIVGKNLKNNFSKKIIDLEGLYITPGLIDAHVHCYYNTQISKSWAGDYSIQPDVVNISNGVTTMIDAGSSGSYNFSHFRSTIIDRSKTKIFALLNIADLGMTSLKCEQFPYDNDLDSFVQCYKTNKDKIVGIKIAHYAKKDFDDINYAKELQKKLNLPIMVDFGVFTKERPYDQLLLDKLSSGDITTHCFRGPVPIVNKNGKLYRYLNKAREKGIKFDIGHGAGSFVFRNVIPAVEQGFLPDIISTDLHVLSYGKYTCGMSDLLSKFISIDSSLFYEYIRRVTEYPKKIFGLKNVGNLSIGQNADIAVWNLRQGDFGYSDTGEGKILSKYRLECEMTFIDGEICFDLNARSRENYNILPYNYGFDKQKEELITPSGEGE